MKHSLIAGLTLSALTLSIATPAYAEPEPFNFRNLPVDRTELCDIEINDDDIQLKYKDFSCKQIIPSKDVAACLSSGGQVGSIGTRPVCVNRKAAQIRPRGGPPPFFPDEVMARSFVPAAVPAELYNGQKDPRAGAARPRPMQPIPLPRD